jgi:glycerophosphoryl diester phosphodiesterase family protein
MFRLLAIGCLVIGAGFSAEAQAEEPSLLERLIGFHVCAHRGGYWFANSNTIERFEAARREGVDVVETDLQLSRDGVPFLFHDSTLDRATTCRGPFSSYSARALAGCRLHHLAHGPERFEAALQWSQGRVMIDAEFKSRAVVRPAIDLVRRYAAYEWVYFQVGARPELYDEARGYDGYVALEAAPRGRTGQSTLDHLLALPDPRLISVQLHPGLATTANIDAIHRSSRLAAADGFRFGTERRWAVWPFQRLAFCTDLYRLGVDIAVTNVPDSCVEQRDAARRTFGPALAASRPVPRVEPREERVEPAQVPGPAIARIAAKYPNAKLIGFARETDDGETSFEISLEDARGRLDVSVSPDGRILEEERLMQPSELPAEVKNGLAHSEYAKWTVDRAERVVVREGKSPPSYEVRIVDGDTRVEAVLDETGAITKVEPAERDGVDD